MRAPTMPTSPTECQNRSAGKARSRERGWGTALLLATLIAPCSCSGTPHQSATIVNQPVPHATATSTPAAAPKPAATPTAPSIPQHPPLVRLEPEPPLSGTPILRLETGMHTAKVTYAAVDAQEKYLATASHDKTVRVWSVADGTLVRTLRLPSDHADGGKAYAVAISPDGRAIAAGGYTDSLYIFETATGTLVRTLADLPRSITSLAYSPDGQYLAAGFGADGIQIYRTLDYQKYREDADYQDAVYGLDFDKTGRLVTASRDKQVYLYSPEFELIRKQKLEHVPVRIAFAPDGGRMAVGFYDAPTVVVLSTDTLTQLLSPQLPESVNNNLNAVAWSKDGSKLFASGRYCANGWVPIVVWDQAGRSQPSLWQFSKDLITRLLPLSDARLAVTASDPLVGVLSISGKPLWSKSAAIANFRSQLKSLNLSNDGSVVEFGYEFGGGPSRVRYALSSMSLSPADETSIALRAADTSADPGLEVTDWLNGDAPKLNGSALELRQYEISRSLAVAPDHRGFVLGTDWYVRYFTKDGAEKWQAATPDVAWAVNIAKNGRVVVAAFGDGTIRWYRASDGKELVALFPHNDQKQWVAWTPEGFFAASPGSEKLIGYQINRGATGTPAFLDVSQLYSAFYRPNLVFASFEDTKDSRQRIAQAQAQVGDIGKLVSSGLPPSVALGAKNDVKLDTSDFELPVELTDQGGGVGKLVVRVNGVVVDEVQTKGLPLPKAPPGKTIATRPLTLGQGKNEITVTAYNQDGLVESLPQKVTVNVDDPMLRTPSLYVLAVGVSSYRDGSMNLKYAAHDAHDVAAVFQEQAKRALYERVEVTHLTDQEATLAGIQGAFGGLAPRIKPNDVFILYLSGHGLARDGTYHFMPHDAVIENADSLKQRALGQEQLAALLKTIKAQKSLVLLDTCSAGAVVKGARGIGTALEDKDAVTRLMRATGRAVIAASTAQQYAIEGYDKHGVFTYALLEGLKGAADLLAHDGRITVDELNDYVWTCVPKITKAKWGYEQLPMRDIQGQPFPVLQASGRSAKSGIDCRLQ